jgi:hypothetical protein
MAVGEGRVVPGVTPLGLGIENFERRMGEADDLRERAEIMQEEAIGLLSRAVIESCVDLRQREGMHRRPEADSVFTQVLDISRAVSTLGECGAWSIVGERPSFVGPDRLKLDVDRAAENYSSLIEGASPVVLAREGGAVLVGVVSEEPRVEVHVGEEGSDIVRGHRIPPVTVLFGMRRIGGFAKEGADVSRQSGERVHLSLGEFARSGVGEASVQAFLDGMGVSDVSSHLRGQHGDGVRLKAEEFSDFRDRIIKLQEVAGFESDMTKLDELVDIARETLEMRSYDKRVEQAQAKAAQRFRRILIPGRGTRGRNRQPSS